MKPIKCTNCNSFYDSSKYDICPHCNSAATTPSKSEELPDNIEKDVEKKKKFSFPLKFNFTKEKGDKPEYADVWSFSGHESKNKSKIENEKPEKFAEYDDDDLDDLDDDFDDDFDVIIDNEVDDVNEFVGEHYEKEEGSDIKVKCDDHGNEEAECSPLEQAIKNTDSTPSFSSDRTIAFYDTSNEIEPVVGWLVCTKGEYFGESFKIKAGRNLVGRSVKMDISLAKDSRVSRDTHSVIVFEPHKKDFFIEAGKGSGLTYLNNEMVMSYQKLKANDEIEIGSSSFLFVPLCGEKFDWESYIEKNK